MRNKTIQRANAAPGISACIMGVLISLGLFLLSYFQLFHLGTEIVLAPFVVIILLTFGDRLLMVLFLFPISFCSKVIKRLKHPGPPQHND